ncbi:MAG TPA: MOSC N-terminal beta barrel domain-containing protein [Burkholderiales bacterium]|nr:MOSC N-terminal beta barrel domain-containing protein [Burkholderiales bacterium]
MRVAALYVYPVKACRAVAVEDAAVGSLGLEQDRRFAFVGDDGRALTQRDQPLLATIESRFHEHALRLDFGGLLQLAFSFSEFIESTSIDVWGKQIPARAAPRSLLAQAADYLGMPVRLARLDPQARRAFVDSQPVLVTTTAMLSNLNLPGVGMERFRPNVVLEGVVLEGAKDWVALEGKDVLLERGKPCGRCEVTTIDQASGERRGPEPLRTLTERFEGNFGVYCRVTRAGRLRRGETLKAS